MLLKSGLFVFCFALLVLKDCRADDLPLRVGVGIADVTGPIAEITFMGYGKMKQKGTGLHTRQFSRAFIFDDGLSRLVFVSVDVGMIGDGLRNKVLANLEKTYKDLYNLDNVMISATHTHSGPGGYLFHMLFDLPSMGFVYENFNAISTGIVKSIVKAHNNLQPARVFKSVGEVLDANINRSPQAYDQNPAEERARHKFNVDKTLTQLKITTMEDQPLGVINWFPVHPTSMNNTNTLVSSDNMGLASILFEKYVEPESLLGKGKFVAAFASTNLGDVSPNIAGPRCQKTGEPCNNLQNSCGRKDVCIASGPGHDMFESTRIIAERIFNGALSMWGSEGEEIFGPIRSIHQYVDMSKADGIVREAGPRMGHKVSGCVPAMGYSFAAGTTDGPGAFSFAQGTKTENPLWNTVRNFLARPTDEDKACHHPKPILLTTGRIKYPVEWQPSIVSTQLGFLGNLIFACVPGEFTTMAGRRLREQLSLNMGALGFDRPDVIIIGLCNTYSDYITTFEEYQIQRYEGASNIFGPNTLDLYIDQYIKLGEALLKKRQVPRGPVPKITITDTISLVTPVIVDHARWSLNFGEVTKQPPPVAHPETTVSARFVSGHPRNNLRSDDTFLTVERQDSPDVWTVIATDADWETRLHWIRLSGILGTSEVEIEWHIPKTVRPGQYRIRHFGSAKSFFSGLHNYQGTTLPFTVQI